jgi:hypothetical protein
MTGAVACSYKGQDYVVGQDSTDTRNLPLGI